jgi:hypothetical protein
MELVGLERGSGSIVVNQERRAFRGLLVQSDRKATQKQLSDWAVLNAVLWDS